MRVASPKDQATDGMTIEQRLQGRMNGIVDSIKRCAELCHCYQRRHVAGEWPYSQGCSAVPYATATVKVFMRIKWQSVFANLAAQFVTHRSNLESDLQLHIDISDTLASIEDKVSDVTVMMEMVFKKLQLPEEKQLMALVQQRGGVERFLASDELLTEMLERQEGGVEKGLGQMSNSSMTLSAFKEELAKDVETILAENTKAFEQQFNAIGMLLRKVKATIQRQSDREIDVLTGKQNQSPRRTHRDTPPSSLYSAPPFTPALATMSTSFPSEGLDEMAAAIQVSQEYQAGKVEKTLNTIGMSFEMLSTGVDSCLGEKVVAVSNSQTVSTIQNVASQAFDTLKGQVSHFAETSKVLVTVLDEVGKVHPFIQGVSYLALISSLIPHLYHCSGGYFVQGGNSARNHPTRE